MEKVFKYPFSEKDAQRESVDTQSPSSHQKMPNSLNLLPLPFVRMFVCALMISTLVVEARLGGPITPQADPQVEFAIDSRSKNSMTFVQTDTRSKNSIFQTVKDQGKKGLGAVKEAAYWVRNQVNSSHAPEILEFVINAKGFITRETASDKSRVDIQWNAKENFREARITMRDSRGKKVGFSETVEGARNAYETLTSFGETPPTFINWERFAGMTRENIINNLPFIGREVVGMLDNGQNSINTLFANMMTIPAIVQTGGVGGMAVASAMINAAASAAGFQDSAQEYVGNLSSKLADAGNKSLQDMISGGQPELKNLVEETIDSAVPIANYSPQELPRGLIMFSPAASAVDEGKTMTVEIQRIGGTAGLLAGSVLFRHAGSTANLDDISVTGHTFVFHDGDEKPKLMKITGVADGIKEGPEKFVLVYPRGDDLGTALFFGTVQEPVKDQSFNISGYAGRPGNVIIYDSYAGATARLSIDSPGISVRANYDAATKNGSASIQVIASGPFRDTDGSTHTQRATFNFSGKIKWNGRGFYGRLSGSRTKAEILVLYDSNTDRYYGVVSVVVSYHIFAKDGSITQPMQYYGYDPESFWFD